MNELIKKEVTAIELYQENKLDSVLADIKKRVSGIVPDLTTDKSRKEIASLAAKVAKSKHYMDDLGKTYVSELKALPKQIDGERKRMRDYLDDLKDEVRKPLTDWENEEKARKDAILKRVNDMNLPSDHEFSTSDEFKTFLKTIAGVKIDKNFGEYEVWANETKEKSCLMVEGLIARKEKEEAEAAEIVRKGKEAQEKAQAEREERIRKETAEAAEKKAAQDKIDTEKKVEADRVAAANKAEADKNAAVAAEKERAEKAEADRVAKEKEELEAAEKKAANKAHRKKINNAATDDLISFCGLTTEQAQKVVTGIVKGEIRYTTVNY